MHAQINLSNQIETNPETSPETNPISIEKSVDEAYSSPAWWYNIRGFFILTFTYRASLWSQIKFFEKNISNLHLEVAVGTGTLLKYILWLRKAYQGPIPQIIAFDYARKMLEGAKKSLAEWPNITVQHGDVTQMKFADNFFQSINVANAFHCFHDPRSALIEIKRVLAPNGSLAVNILLYPRGPRLFQWIASSINVWGIKKGILVSPFHIDQIRALFRECGFVISKEIISGNTVNVVATKSNAP